MSADSGGPAFPVAYSFHNEREGCDEVVRVDGMTLRDYFAAKAMQAALNRADMSTDKPEHLSSGAYAVADAMLKERAK